LAAVRRASGHLDRRHLNPRDASYNVAEFIEVHGRLDPALFAAAVRQLAGEVNAVRLRFIEDNGRVRQVFAPAADVPLLFFDTSGAESPRAAAEAWMRLTRPALSTCRRVAWPGRRSSA
jgi:Condensation domain